MEANYEAYPVGENPYGVAPAGGVSMTESQRHEAGNALAANAEARAVAEVKAQVLMARQFPRDPRESVEKILRECERPTLADKAVYSFPRGNETVSGPSIRLAEMMARNWGNCTFGLEVLERNTSRSPGYSVVRAYAWDLETNTYIARQFEVKHWRTTKTGGYALKEDRDVYELEANMGSRRMRAAILQMIPGDVTQMAVDKCRMTTEGGLSAKMNNPKDREALIVHTIRLFEKMGVSQKDLEGYLGAIEKDWTADHMLRVKELKNSLDDGVLLLGDVFPHLGSSNQNDTISKEQIQELMKLIADTGRQGEISAALKKMGIAKVADVPVSRHEEVMSMVMDFVAAGKPEAETKPQ